MTAWDNFAGEEMPQVLEDGIAQQVTTGTRVPEYQTFFQAIHCFERLAKILEDFSDFDLSALPGLVKLVDQSSQLSKLGIRLSGHL